MIVTYGLSVGGTYCHLNNSDERWWVVNHHSGLETSEIEFFYIPMALRASKENVP